MQVTIEIVEKRNRLKPVVIGRRRIRLSEILAQAPEMEQDSSRVTSS
jgi:hypothetical protein